jgi:hypothetical protein
MPTTGRGSGKRKRNKPTPKEVEDEDSPRNLRSRSPVATGSSIIEDNDSYQKPKVVCRLFLLTRIHILKCKLQSTRNPIYYFYEKVERDAKGSIGNVGDKHYKCCHGSRKVLTITKAMKSSLNGNFLAFFPYAMFPADITGLVGNLKSCSPSMFRLYSVLKSRRPEGHITQEEIEIASRKKPLTAEASAEFLGGLEAQSENIKDAFTKQEQQAVVRPCLLSISLCD